MEKAAKFSAAILFGMVLGIIPALVGAEGQEKEAITFEPKVELGSETYPGDGVLIPPADSRAESTRMLAESPVDLAVPLPEVQLCTEDFEEEFPGDAGCDWELRWCGSGYTWDDDDCRASTGVNSGWCANGRADNGGGGLDPCEQSYPNGLCAWMIAGPFDLSGAADAYVMYDWWLRCEGNFYDKLFVGYSTNGAVFTGERFTGDFGDTWHPNRVLSLQDALGAPQVWIGILFGADVSVQFNSLPNGAFVDNIRIVRDGQAPVLPDLVVADIQFDDPDCPTQVRVLVRNEGSEEAAASGCRLWLDDSYLCDASVPALAPGGQFWTDWCDLEYGGSGVHEVEACADYGDALNESSESNNCRTEGFICAAAALPDLVVLDLMFNGASCPSQVQAKVKNIGGGEAGSSVCRIWLDDTTICSPNVVALAPGEEVWTAACPLGAYSFGLHDVEACADYNGAVGEEYENNNCRTESFGCAPGELTYSITGNLNPCAGEEAVIYVNLVNEEPIKAYGVHLSFDPDIFVCTGVSVDGTRGAGADYPITAFTESSASAGIVFSADCDASIPAGDGPILRIVLEARAGAPVGMTTLDLIDNPPSINLVTYCDGSIANPTLLDGTADICGDAFIRGDTDADGAITILDPVYNLNYLFSPGSPAPPCRDAADFDDSGNINLADPLASLRFQYGSDDPPAPPFPDCGTDPTDDPLDCGSYPACGPAALLARQLGSTGQQPVADLSFEIGGASGSDSLLVRMILANSRSLVAFELTAGFEASGLEFLGLDRSGSGLEPAGFFSGRADEEAGQVRLGCVFDLTLETEISRGTHDVGQLIFRVKDQSMAQGSRIEFVEGYAIEADMTSYPISGGGVVVPPLGAVGMTKILLSAPNPYRPNAPMSFDLDQASAVRISIFNVRGQRIRDLLDSEVLPGHHDLSWDGKTNTGEEAATGVYYLRGEFGRRQLDRKMVLAR